MKYSFDDCVESSSLSAEHVPPKSSLSTFSFISHVAGQDSCKKVARVKALTSLVDLTEFLNLHSKVYKVNIAHGNIDTDICEN